MKFLNISSRYTIRPARSDDLTYLLYMGEEARKENSTYFPPIDGDWTMRNFEIVLSNYENGCIFVAEDKSRVFGFIVGRSDRFLFSRKRYAIGEFWYVLPEFRKKYPWAGMALLRKYMKWADDVAQWTFFRADNMNPRLEALFSRVGLKPFGSPLYGVHE